MEKICFIIPTSNAGGIETYLLRFLRLHSNRFDTHVIVLSSVKGALTKDYDQLDGVTIVYHPIGYFHIHNYIWFYWFLRKHGFTTLCDFNGNFAGIPLSIGKAAGVKKRIALYRRSSNAFKPTTFNNFYNRLVNYVVFVKATHIISNSRAAFEYFFENRWQSDARFSIIPNGIPSVANVLSSSQRSSKIESLGIEPGTKLIGHVGRLDPAKNHNTLLQVALFLKTNYSDLRFKLVLCGLGTDSEAFRQRIHKLGIDSLVVPLGQRYDVQELLQCVDVFYFPSITEGQPNALLEAMSAGIPIVASDISAIREVMPKTYHGNLVDPLAVEQAADAIIGILAGERATDSLYLKEWCAKHFDLETNMNKFLKTLLD